ncbi:MAG: UDP-3-O-(3-hydroxymyristoyl)glucosamine N-acyltransferase [Myxococcales bacterium]|nr:UDP-3-O-(3-hydroxymyristoyl)glucosamine N-acyltransferase [Myxococcales bacterium]
MNLACPIELGDLAERLAGTCVGNPHLLLTGVNGLAEAQRGELTFFTNQRYRDHLATTQASAVILKEEALEHFPLAEGKGAIVCGDPYLAFAKASSLFHPAPVFEPGIDSRAIVEPGAQIDPTATVMACAYVGKGAIVGPHAVLFPFVFVGEDARIQSRALLYPGVVVRERCVIGEGSILQPGVTIGGDGFGFAFDASVPCHFKIPQAGTVEIGREVEIGAGSAIDRATLGVTRIGDGTKIDNLVQIGHNVTVGPLSILCGQVGIAGSSSLGKGVICGGQVGLGNHLHICDGTRLGPKSGVMADVTEPGEYLGVPLVKARDFMRQQVAIQKGPDTLKALQKLERRVAELEAKLEAINEK